MLSKRALFALAVLMLASGLAVAAGQRGTGSVRGTAIDGSGGVLPGVTVVATSDRGTMLVTTVTDAKGEYEFRDLPVGPVDVVFHLDGFADAKARVQVQAGSVSQAVERLELAGLAESIVVRGDPPPPPPPPSPVITPVPPHDQASVCGPAKAESAAVTSFGIIQSRRTEARQGLIAAGDQILIEGGFLNGLGVGQNLVARRRYQSKGFDGPAVSYTGEHTSGVLQIVAVEEHQSVAVVVYACDEMMRGDYLAAFQPEPLRAPESYGVPAFDDAGKILFGDAGQMLGYARRMMVIDRGAAQGIRPGQRLTIFRRPRGNAPTIVGDSVVVAVRADSATIRVEQSSDAVQFGDLVAPQRSGTRAN